MNTGFGSMEGAKKAQDSGPKEEFTRWWVNPDEPKRGMFIETDPACWWDHFAKLRDGTFVNATCLKKNGIAAECPFCDADNWPSYVGALTILDLSIWEDKKGVEHSYSKREFIAKMGTEDKQGVLRKLQRLAKKHGRLAGLVFDINRPGKLTENCGSEFDIVESACIPEDQIESFLRSESMVDPERKPWEPLDHAKLHAPMDIEKMREIAKQIAPRDAAKKSGGDKPEKKVRFAGPGASAQSRGSLPPRASTAAPASREPVQREAFPSDADDDIPF
jgi:hypothetical protein